MPMPPALLAAMQAKKNGGQTDSESTDPLAKEVPGKKRKKPSKARQAAIERLMKSKGKKDGNN